MKRYIITVVALTFLLTVVAPLASAQATSTQPAAAQDPAAEEAAAYKAFYDAYTAKDLAKELEMGKIFVEKFPSNKNAEYVKKEIVRVRSILLQNAITAKNSAEVVRLGKEALAADPNNVDYAIYLAIQLRTIDTNLQYAADIAEFTNTAIRLIESGKTPTQAANTPAFDKNKTLAYFQNLLGGIDEHGKSTDKALEHFHQATTLDPMNAAYFFNCGRLHQAKYTVVAQKYQSFSQEDRTAAEPKPEVKAALDEANKEADAVINCWARFMALKSDYSQDTRDKVNESLTGLYKYRHNDSEEGLKKLIEDNKNSPTPVSMTPPPVAPATPPADQKAVDQNAMGAKPGTAPAKPAPAKPNGKKPR
ncbi:MAG: hypothetical protein WBV94_22175 [Blastocatellia bacterium]